MSSGSAPLVSVIVPNYRHAPFLKARLDAVLGQTVRDIEVILLDDASDDGSAAVLRAAAAADPRITHVVVNERNSGGPFLQWRRGIALARGEWVWIAESDDSCSTELLERLLAKDREAGATLGLVYAQSQVVDEAGLRKGSMLQHTSTFHPDPFHHAMVMDGLPFITRFLKAKNVIPNASAVIFRRSLVQDDALWEGTGGMRMCGDWLFWVRLVQRTRVGFVAEELNHFREHGAVSRMHRTLERKRLRLQEESVVRNALAQVPGVDQRQEEEALYAAWSRLFPVRSFLGAAFDQVRLKGRSRPSFQAMVWRQRWQDRVAR